jgi:hypothetical protein
MHAWDSEAQGVRHFGLPIVVKAPFREEAACIVHVAGRMSGTACRTRLAEVADIGDCVIPILVDEEVARRCVAVGHPAPIEGIHGFETRSKLKRGLRAFQRPKYYSPRAGIA